MATIFDFSGGQVLISGTQTGTAPFTVPADQTWIGVVSGGTPGFFGGVVLQISSSTGGGIDSYFCVFTAGTGISTNFPLASYAFSVFNTVTINNL